MRFKVFLSMLVLGVGASAVFLAQSSPVKGTARELFYSSVKKAAAAEKTAAPVKPPLGLRYSIRKEGAAGSFTEVDPDAVFRTGDRIKLNLKANDNGFLYIVQRGTSGKWKVLFPPDQIDSRGNRIEKDREQDIPQTTYFYFSGAPGDERLFVVLSREPEADWDKLIRSVGGQSGGDPKVAQTASIDDTFINRAKQSLGSRDLVYEKGGDAAGTDEGVYVVNVAGTSKARVQVEITLKHR